MWTRPVLDFRMAEDLLFSPASLGQAKEEYCFPRWTLLTQPLMEHSFSTPHENVAQVSGLCICQLALAVHRDFSQLPHGLSYDPEIFHLITLVPLLHCGMEVIPSHLTLILKIDVGLILVKGRDFFPLKAICKRILKDIANLTTARKNDKFFQITSIFVIINTVRWI